MNAEKKGGRMIAANYREVALKHIVQSSDSRLKNTPTPCSWKQAWRESFTKLPDLLAFLQLDTAQFMAHLDLDHAATFPLRVPISFAERMRKGDPLDPLLAQVLPRMVERVVAVNFKSDPVEDLANSPSRGLIHKYASRALLIASGTCAVNCRYCFRREYPYAAASLSPSALLDATEYLQQHPEINEVILSGGDPLALDNRALQRSTDALLALSQIRRLRVHTRTPIVLPTRIDTGFMGWVQDLKVPLIMVLHSNHANEWADRELQSAMRALKKAGVTLLNQAVLLRGVNDTSASQIALSEALFAAGVLPYYLNLLDPVSGSAHFAVSDTDAHRIYQDMAAALPGFLLPKLVRDVVGSDAKQVMATR
jgi:L-lysine 2,3-aminomutase